MLRIIKLVFLCWLMVLVAFTHAADLANEQTAMHQDTSASSMPEFCVNLPRAAYAALPRIEYPSEWFELYRVAPGVTAIYEPYQWQEVISYLIEGTHSALLFDTGNGIEDIAVVVNSLTDKPISVLNSHSHYDHVGGNHAFDKIFGMNTEFTRARQKGIANKEIAIELSAEALCKQPPSGATQSTHLGRAYSITETVQDGSIIDLGGRQLEVISIPGHTPDAIALVDREAGFMWTGDSYYSGPIWLYAQETDLVAYQKSLERLIKESKNIKALLPAHNTPWVAPSVLPRVKAGFNAMLNGKAKRVGSWPATVVYQIDGETEFSFLMRDEALPY